MPLRRLTATFRCAKINRHLTTIDCGGTAYLQAPAFVINNSRDVTDKVDLQANSRWVISGICICLAAITWLVFAQTLWHDFVNYDDESYVYENARVSAGLSWAGIGWAFTHVHSENWHPLTTISHMLDCQLYGLKAGGHHFTNVVLHSVAVLLLFALLREMSGMLWRSAFVAALFAIHPLRVESVAWIAERKDVLSGVFFMLTLLAYLRYARAPSLGRYGMVSLLFALGLMCKPMLVTLPFVLLLLDYWPLKRFAPVTPARSKSSVAPGWIRHSRSRQLFLEKIPLLALSAGSGIVTLLAQQRALGWIERLPLVWRLKNSAVTCIAYIWQMLWPVNLAVFYPHPENRLPGWEIILAVAVLVAVTLAGIALRKVRPYFITGWLWYLGMLLPVIGLIQVGWQSRADRYTYLPQIGLYILATWSIADLSARWRRQRELLSGGAAILLGILSWRAWVQTSYWRDSETLWTHALAVTSDNDVAQNNLGIVLLRRGQLDEAISRLATAVKLRPENAPAHDNLAKAFLQKGEVAKAMEHYRRLLEIQPDNAEAHNILGTVLVQQGRIREALDQWQETLAIQPENGNAKSNLAWVFATCPEASIRNGPKAVQLAEQALRLSGGKIPVIFRTLAAAYAESGRFPDAIHAAQRGFELATSQHNSALADEFQRHIVLYESGTPLRDSSLTDGHSSP
jgi:protein O-mannosyl-transferase